MNPVDDRREDDAALIADLESMGAEMRRSRIGRILSVDFRSCSDQVNDAIVTRLAGLPRLKEVYLQATDISDDSMAVLADLPRLQVLNADETRVTDQHLDRFLGNRRLTLLSLAETDVSRDKVAELRKKMIGTRIVFR